MNEQDFIKEDVAFDELNAEERVMEQEAQRLEKKAGDVTGWKPAKRRIRVRRGGPSHSFSIRFASDEIDLLQEVADAQDVTLTEFIRNAALSTAKSNGEVMSRSEVRELLQTLRSAVEEAGERVGVSERSAPDIEARR